MDNRGQIYKELLAGKKIMHATWGLGDFIKMDLTTGKLVDQDNCDYDTTFKTPSEWNVRLDRRTFNVYRHTYKDYDGKTMICYSEKASFSGTTEGEDDANSYVKSQTIGSFTMED